MREDHSGQTFSSLSNVLVGIFHWWLVFLLIQVIIMNIPFTELIKSLRCSNFQVTSKLQDTNVWSHQLKTIYCPIWWLSFSRMDRPRGIFAYWPHTSPDRPSGQWSDGYSLFNQTCMQSTDWPPHPVDMRSSQYRKPMKLTVSYVLNPDRNSTRAVHNEVDIWTCAQPLWMYVAHWHLHEKFAFMIILTW